ncbi:(2R)-3-sulfolactate dehydrogenase (NADP+) [Stella humosa]|uniref:(2R)-3-sulfolactate dehydrogenase (NADP+) n=1 Tax=Stella humosa TaxID=94 RepID=A0A3N1MEC5_9PROT|nr:Ldh family oxidoreductase [Stella humosa]ROQ01080.1 (2R)-3-sulfolactate dehydrogenase (NADP+) [Stella humosa]BBK31452.1 lactate dehydrogenase [Stella humosa]
MAVMATDALVELATAVLVAAGTEPGNAAVVADALVAADADQIASHGVARLPAYADQVRSGKVDGHARPRLEQTAAATLRVDAADGFAFPAVRLGLDRAIALAPQTGIVAVGVHRSHHFGVAGHHVERLAAAGLVGLAFTNSPAALAPWGGNRPIYGTNPIAFACPRRGQGPLVVDLSLSKVARGRIMVAAQKGEAIPEGWAVDGQGRPTTDAKAALAGTMLPLGDAKGAALALMVELLAAGLTGGNYGFEAGSFFTADGSKPRIGHLFIAIHPPALAGDGFLDRVAILLDAATGQDGVRLPGDRRLAARTQAAAGGVSVPDALLADLRARAG